MATWLASLMADSTSLRQALLLHSSSAWVPGIGGNRQFGAVCVMAAKATANDGVVPLCHMSVRGRRSEPKAFLRPDTLIPAAAHLLAMPLQIKVAVLNLILFFEKSCLQVPLDPQPLRRQPFKGTYRHISSASFPMHVMLDAREHALHICEILLLEIVAVYFQGFLC